MFILQSSAPNLPTLALPSSISTKSGKYPQFLCSNLLPFHGISSFRLCSRVPCLRTRNFQAQMEMDGADADDAEDMEDETDISWRGAGFGRRDEEEKDYDRDPEFAEILGSCLDDPDKARFKMEERLRKKRNRILHTKTGSPKHMKVTFNK